MTETEEDPITAWMDFAHQAVAQLQARTHDWSSLAPPEQERAALWLLEADAHNGGLQQFYCNWGDEACGHALRALSRLGEATSLKALQAVQALMQLAYRRSQQEGARQVSTWDLARFLDQAERADLVTLTLSFCDPEPSEMRAHLALTHYRQGAARAPNPNPLTRQDHGRDDAY